MRLLAPAPMGCRASFFSTLPGKVTSAARSSRPLVVGVDARELQGRPTGTGRYLRNLLRRWTAGAAGRFVLYFNGDAPDDPLLAHPSLTVRVLPRTSPGLLWQEVR